MRHLVWLRADLRSLDNTALHHACLDTGDDVACLYFITPGQWQAHDVAGCRINMELRALHQLQETLADLRIPLFVSEVPDYQAIPAALLAFAEAHDATALHFNHQYEWNEQQRDHAVCTVLEQHGIRCHGYHDQCAIAPGQLLTQEKRAYSVFTPFKRQWLAALQQRGITVLPEPRPRSGRWLHAAVLPEAVPDYPSHMSARVEKRLWPAGEEEALSRLAQFAERGLRHYAARRDLPALDGTSTLSPYLAMGCLSVRQCLNTAFNAMQTSLAGREDIDTWISELAWRDFYKHVMAANPRVCRHQPYQTTTRQLPWRHDEAAFRQWCEGRTGFPIVDAAMRQLKATGWMHNRLRMITAMFLSKDLFIDWRWGERFFMQHLVDGDFSANNGGWQWSASTGTDAVPYFRVFNPLLQSRKVDPDGNFLRQWLPELQSLDKRQIHDPPDSVRQALGYPLPMVDHATAKAHTLACFQALAHSR